MCRCAYGTRSRAAQDEDGEGGGGDSVSASEARRRLERFRAKVKAEQQAAAAAKDTVAKVRHGGGWCGRAAGDGSDLWRRKCHGPGLAPTARCFCTAWRGQGNCGRLLLCPAPQAGDKAREAQEEAVKVAFEGAVRRGSGFGSERVDAVYGGRGPNSGKGTAVEACHHDEEKGNRHQGQGIPACDGGCTPP